MRSDSRFAVIFVLGTSNQSKPHGDGEKMYASSFYLSSIHSAKTSRVMMAYHVHAAMVSSALHGGIMRSMSRGISLVRISRSPHIGQRSGCSSPFVSQ
jgi:hypothetical protein